MTIIPPIDPCNLAIEIPTLIDDEKNDFLEAFRDQSLDCANDPLDDYQYFIDSLFRYSQNFSALNKAQQGLLMHAVSLCDEQLLLSPPTE